MPRWSLLAGAPRFGEALPVHRLGGGKESAASRVASARATALVGGGLVVLAGAVLFGTLLGPASPTLGAVLAAVALAAVALASAGALRGAGRVVVPLGLLALTVSAALALAGPVGGAIGGGLVGLPTIALDAIAVAVLLLVPIHAGLRVHAIGLALGAAGPTPRRAPYARAWWARSAEDVTLSRPPRGPRLLAPVARHLVLRAGLAGLLVADALGTILVRVGARASGRAIDRVRADFDLDALAAALAERGLDATRRGATLVAHAPPAPASEVRVADERSALARVAGALSRPRAGAPEIVRVRRRELLLPRADGAVALDLAGPPAAVRRFRRVLETELAFRGLFTTSLEARRLERRLNALAEESTRAASVEERGALLEEALVLERAATGRAFLDEEWTVLAAWKSARLRALLQDRLLAAPREDRPANRLVAPAATVAADPQWLVAAGGLAGLRSATFVPYHLVPASTAWGESEWLVNALTGKADLAESRAILHACRASGTRLLLDGARATQFIPRPRSAPALYGEVRRLLRREVGYWGPLAMDEALVETLYVPFVESSGRFVNAVTGAEAPDVRAALPPTIPKGTLV